jgi:hypothetical protein
MQNNLAPIVLFVYNRPVHTQQCLQSLCENDLANQSELFIYADGPKEGASVEQLQKIIDVKKLIKEKKWCRKVHIYERDNNMGLANSIIEGVTDVVNKFGKVIVIEDDLILSKGFLKYMNEGLATYSDRDNVYSINAYMPSIDNGGIAETVLLPLTSSWGWATWKNKWDVFDYEMKQKNNILENKFLQSRFNLGDYNYVGMLNHGNNSWSIRWYYSVFKRNGLCVFPTQTLVWNIGFDGSGVNHTFSTISQRPYLAETIFVKNNSGINLDFYSKFINFYSSQKRSLFKRVLVKIKFLKK